MIDATTRRARSMNHGAAHNAPMANAMNDETAGHR